MTPTVSVLIFMYAVGIIVGVVALLDWHTRRKDHQSKHPKLPF